MNWIGSVRRARREHLAAARDAPRPVGEAVGVIAGADDVRRTDHGLARAERLLDDLLARGLEPAVILLGDLLRVRIVERRELVVLVDARRRQVRVRGDARHIDVVLHVVLEQSTAGVHLSREVTGVVDDDVPLAALQHVDRAGDVAVADQRLDVGEQSGIALAAVEQRQLVTAGAQLAHEVRADEAGAAEDQHLRRLSLRRGRAFVQQQPGGGGGAHLDQFASVHAESPWT